MPSQPNIMYLKPKSEAMRVEYPAEKRFVSKIEYPKEGGILSWFEGERYPEKQLVYPEMFAILNPVKRFPINSLKLLKNSRLAVFLVILGSILPGCRKLKRMALEMVIDMFWCGLHYVALQPNYYCRSAREIRRTALPYFKNIRLLDTLCLVWEYDNAYRCRFQDFFGILNQANFLLNPRRELKRTIIEYKKRELSHSISQKFKMIDFAINAIIFFYGKKIKRFIEDLDFEKVRMDIGDRYWTYHRLDYNVDGLDLIERMRKKSLMKLKAN